MKKRITIILSIFLICIMIATKLTKVIATTENSFFNTNKIEICKDETLEMTLNISSIEYDKFEFKLSSNLDTNSISVKDNIEIEKYNNDIRVNIDKTKNTIDKITFYYTVPENSLNNTSIVLNAEVLIEKQGNEEEKEVVKNKRIEVKVVENKQGVKDEIGSAMSNKNENNYSNNENSNSLNNGINFGSNSNSNFGTNMYSGNSQMMNMGSSMSMGTSSTQLNIETAIYNGSANNYLESLVINEEDLNIDFRKENTTYFIETEGRSSISVSTKAEDSDAKVCITGNNNLKTGDNKILISVTAENGDIRYYRIFVTNN